MSSRKRQGYSVGYIIGALLGDGGTYRYQVTERRCKNDTTTSYHVRWSCIKSRKFVEKIRKHLLIGFDETPTVYLITKTNFKKSTIKGLDPNYVYHGFEVICHSKRCFDKVAPIANIDFIDKSGKETQCGFLSGFYDAEGCLTNGSIKISNKDKELLAFVQRLLKPYGIKSYLYDYPSQTCCRLNIHRTQDVEKFLSIIGEKNG